jgi:hypothetical protein
MTPSRPIGGADKAGRRGANGSMTATRGTSRTWPSRSGFTVTMGGRLPSCPLDQHCQAAQGAQSQGMGRQQPKTRTRRSGRRSATIPLGSCPTGIGRCGGCGWSTLQPVGQWPTAEALHEAGALAQSPTGRGGRVARFGPTRRLLQGPGGDRHRHGDECQLPRPPLGSGPHAHSSSRCLEVESWSVQAASAPAG